MPRKLLFLLVLSALSLGVAVAHADPVAPATVSTFDEAVELEEEGEGEEEDSSPAEECEEGEEEFAEGEISRDELREICAADEEAPNQARGGASRRPHPHRKGCRKHSVHKRHCRGNRRDSGFDSRARRGARSVH